MQHAISADTINEARRHLRTLRAMHELLDLLEECSDQAFIGMVRDSVREGVRQNQQQEELKASIVKYEQEMLLAYVNKNNI